MSRFYPVLPVAKPRMTQRDRWAKRPCVLRYHDFKDKVRSLNIELPQPCKVVFCLPMPVSWSKKRRAAHKGQPHRSRPDIDNLTKALQDALYGEDAHIWSIWAEKRWSDQPGIIVEELRC